jgi:hypothetical protein
MVNLTLCTHLHNYARRFGPLSILFSPFSNFLFSPKLDAPLWREMLSAERFSCTNLTTRQPNNSRLLIFAILYYAAAFLFTCAPKETTPLSEDAVHLSASSEANLARFPLDWQIVRG